MFEGEEKLITCTNCGSPQKYGEKRDKTISGWDDQAFLIYHECTKCHYKIILRWATNRSEYLRIRLQTLQASPNSESVSAHRAIGKVRLELERETFEHNLREYQ